MDMLSNILADQAPLFSLLVIISAFFMYWKSGALNVSTKIISDFKTRVEQLEKDVARLTESDSRKRQEIDRLNQIMAEKDRYIDTLKSVSIDNNPRIKEFMDAVMLFISHYEENENAIKKSVKSMESLLQNKINK